MAAPDPNIILQGKGFQLPDPLAAWQNAAKISDLFSHARYQDAESAKIAQFLQTRPELAAAYAAAQAGNPQAQQLIHAAAQEHHINMNGPPTGQAAAPSTVGDFAANPNVQTTPHSQEQPVGRPAPPEESAGTIGGYVAGMPREQDQIVIDSIKNRMGQPTARSRGDTTSMDQQPIIARRVAMMRAQGASDDDIAKMMAAESASLNARGFSLGHYLQPAEPAAQVAEGASAEALPTPAPQSAPNEFGITQTGQDQYKFASPDIVTGARSSGGGGQGPSEPAQAPQALPAPQPVAQQPPMQFAQGAPSRGFSDRYYHELLKRGLAGEANDYLKTQASTADQFAQVNQRNAQALGSAMMPFVNDPSLATADNVSRALLDLNSRGLVPGGLRTLPKTDAEAQQIVQGAVYSGMNPHEALQLRQQREHNLSSVQPEIQKLQALRVQISSANPNDPRIAEIDGRIHTLSSHNPVITVTDIEGKGAMARAGAQGGALGKYLGEQFGDIMKAGTTAADQAANLEILKQLQPNLKTGFAGDQLQALRKAGEFFGINTADAAAGDVFKALSQRFALEMKGAGSSNLMPGAVSNFEEKQLLAMAPALTNTPQGNMALIDLYQQRANRDIQIKNMAIQYAQAHGGNLDVGFSDEVNRYIQEHPLTKPAILSGGSGGAKPTASVQVGSAAKAAQPTQNAPMPKDPQIPQGSTYVGIGPGGKSAWRTPNGLTLEEE